MMNQKCFGVIAIQFGLNEGQSDLQLLSNMMNDYHVQIVKIALLDCDECHEKDVIVTGQWDDVMRLLVDQSIQIGEFDDRDESAEYMIEQKYIWLD